MTRLGLALLAALALAGCGTGKGTIPTPGTRAIYHAGGEVYVICDHGNRLYQTKAGALVMAEGGCPDGRP